MDSYSISDQSRPLCDDCCKIDIGKIIQLDPSTLNRTEHEYTIAKVDSKLNSNCTLCRSNTQNLGFHYERYIPYDVSARNFLDTYSGFRVAVYENDRHKYQPYCPTCLVSPAGLFSIPDRYIGLFKPQSIQSKACSILNSLNAGSENVNSITMVFAQSRQGAPQIELWIAILEPSSQAPETSNMLH